MPSGTQPLPSPLSQEVGRVLASAIAAHTERQFTIAEAAGMSPAQLSRTIGGKKVFTLDQLDALCAVLELDLVEVITEADHATRTRARPVSLAEQGWNDAQAAPANVIHLRPNVAAPVQDERAVAKKKSRDRGGDDGEG